MATNYTDKEKDLIKEVEKEIGDWKEIKKFDMENYLCSSNEEINERNNQIRHLSQEIYAYYFNLRDEIEQYLGNIYHDIDEYHELIRESKREEEYYV